MGRVRIILFPVRHDVLRGLCYGRQRILQMDREKEHRSGVISTLAQTIFRVEHLSVPCPQGGTQVKSANSLLDGVCEYHLLCRPRNSNDVVGKIEGLSNRAVGQYMCFSIHNNA